MERVMNVGNLLLALIVVVFFVCLYRSLKNENLLNRLVVLVLIGIIITTIFLSKGG